MYIEFDLNAVRLCIIRSMGSTNSRLIHLSTVKDFDLTPPDNKNAKIGIFLYIPNDIEKKHTVYWEKCLTKLMRPQQIIKTIKERKLHKGFPQKFRWDTWCTLLKIRPNLQSYFSLPVSSEYYNDIEKDLDRTFPDHIYFDKHHYGYFGQSALRRLLHKFCSKFPSIGYFQGLNFITGFLLMVSGGIEAEVFAFLESFVSRFDLTDFFSKDMKGLNHSLYIFERIFENNLCKLYWHFKNEEISEDMWVFKFFLTFFTSSFQPHITVYCWDFLLLEGNDSMTRIVLSILKANQEKLLGYTTFEILSFFAGIGMSIAEPQRLLKKACRIKVNKEKKEGFEREYKSLPCNGELYKIKTESKQGCESPTVTIQMVTEEPPDFLMPRYKSVHNYGTRNVINPFLVDSAEKSGSGDSEIDDSFNAEDVLNNLVTESDWEGLYIR